MFVRRALIHRRCNLSTEGSKGSSCAGATLTMTVKIKISYQTQKELQHVLGRLGLTSKDIKLAKQQGNYKRAYVELKLSK